MKLRRGISVIVLIFLLWMSLSTAGNVKAVRAANPLHLNIKQLRDSGYGYQLQSRKNIWKIYDRDDLKKTIYCLKAGPGFGSSDMEVGTPQETPYTVYFDMKDPSSIPTEYQRVLPATNSDDYKAILWLLDHFYIPPKDDSERIAASSSLNRLLSEVTEYEENEGLQRDVQILNYYLQDIDAIQQVAIWYFTNRGNNDYHVEEPMLYINSTPNTASNFRPISDVDETDGEDREEAYQALYEYLIETAKKEAPNYQMVSSDTPALQIEKTDIQFKVSGDRIIIGPYKVKKLRDMDYTVAYYFEDANGTEINDVQYVDANGSSAMSRPVDQEFYISIPKTTDSSTITFKISGNYYTTELNYWGVDNPNTNFQPVVIPERKEKPMDDSITAGNKEFDLALRKFITQINGTDLKENGRYTREPQVDVTKLKDRSETTATYNHPKTPIKVKIGDEVVYTIRVYNEGQLNGYVNEITDHLPQYLEFIQGDELNTKYGWELQSDGKTVKTSITKKDSSTNIYDERKEGADKLVLEAFEGRQTLDYIDVQIKCRVKSTAVKDLKITNIADITAYIDEKNQTDSDRDSDAKNVDPQTETTLPQYKDTEIESGEPYIPGQEDDDDFEKLLVGDEFDLSLRKFITSVNTKELKDSSGRYLREPQVDVTALKAGTAKTATYNHPKTPIRVEIGDIVTYTIRVYNEGGIDGYVTEITDRLPEFLEFIPGDELNTKYGWTVSNDRTIKTTITSKGNANSSTVYATRKQDADKLILKAYDGGNSLDYIDVQIKCKVKDTAKNDQKITNIAEITKFTDANDKAILDRDSTEDSLTNDNSKDTDNIKDDNLPTDQELPGYKDTQINRGDKYIPGQQDDDDFEKLLVGGQFFDLALRKFTISIAGEPVVDENGKYLREPQISNEELEQLAGGNKTTAEKVHPKNALSVKTGDRVIYIIRVYNEGNIPGYAEEVTDYLPNGLKFVEDSPINAQYGWSNPSKDGKTIVTTHLHDRLLNAFDGKTLDYEDLQIECEVTATASEKNQSLKNIAEITEDSDKDRNPVDDQDSTPDNVDQEKYKDKSQEDDDDFEDLVLPGQHFDLALRKFIANVNGKDLKDESGKYLREPQVDITDLASGKSTTATYNHPKTPVEVEVGNEVIYTIRVYNEGTLKGYVNEITDHLPEYLEYLPTDALNIQYGWSVSEDGRTVKTTITSPTNPNASTVYEGRKTGTDKLILEAFDGESDLDYIDVQIKCKVKESAKEDTKITNIADITSYVDENNKTDSDRDSDSNNVELPTDPNLPGYKDPEINKGDKYIPGQEDDDDFEKLVIPGKYFDLSLRKFISEVTTGDVTKKYDRAPQVDVTDLASGNATTATYNHPKDPVGISNGSIVTYTIRAYNEGEIDGYVTEITDHLPEQLEFIVDDEFNAKYGWTVSEDGRTISTDITSPNTEKSASRDEIYKDRVEGEDKVLLKAFDGQKLDYIGVQVKCKVKNNISLSEKITNIADITDYTDDDGEKVPDRDSQEDNVNLPTDEELPDYKQPEIENGDKYIPGQQDDDDFEKLVVERFDLALRKFITGVNDEEITNRAPVFTKVSDTKYKYVHPKDPVEVANGNIVTYTLRIFNEGNIAGYAQKVKDDLPDGLEYLPDNEINKEYRWKMYDGEGNEVTQVEKAQYIETDYLSKEQEEEEGANLLSAFNPETMTMPDYRDIKIAFKVTEPNTSDRIIINTAEITDDSDEEGNPVEDVDSKPDNDKEDEDDIDKESVKVKYFDLALKKWVSESIVTYNGKTTVNKTGHTGNENPEPPAKVELKASQMSKTTVKFKFIIKVTNEGEIAGYAKEIIDYIPNGLKFNKADNPKWREEGGKVLTDQLKDKLLQPGESATVEIILTWVNNKENMGEKVNWAEIYKDENEYGSPDIDSKPGNNRRPEDDIDDAPVVLSVKTGSEPTYVVLALITVSMVLGGVILIKRFVIEE